VIGVAADVRNSGLAEPTAPEYYRLRMNDGRQAGRVTVALFRTGAPAASLAPLIQREIAALDPALPVEVTAMAQRVNALQDRPRFLAFLIGAFAVAGFSLALTGLYGVLSFLVAQRHREIGVRLAVGASSSHIASIFFRQSMGWTLGGVLAGIVASYGLGGAVRSLLFDVAPYDPTSLAFAAGVLLVAAVLITALPARRAMRIDPSAALRSE
jgi:ABC-type antimicrobial peptide transport system permease subunit